MKAFLFALTGLGNVVLETLIKEQINVVGLSTRMEKDKFPYFECENIVELCNKNKIPVFEDKVSFPYDCDLLISATFHKKILIDECKFKLGVNIHPSFLPFLKGKDPIKNAIETKEQNLGITTHKITNKFDIGDILFQKRIRFYQNDTKKSLIRKLKPLYKSHTNMLIKYYKKNYEHCNKI